LVESRGDDDHRPLLVFNGISSAKVCEMQMNVSIQKQSSKTRE
jgi:hypothetical protein